MLIKQAQYKNGRKVAPIVSKVGLQKGLKYAENPDDPNHKDKVEIHGPLGFRCSSKDDFASQAVERFKAYEQSKIGTAGRKSKGELVEQLIVNPDPLSDLTDFERRLVIKIVADMLGPESAVLGFWHVGINGRNRDDAHVFIVNIVKCGDPALRKTRLIDRAPNIRNYRELLRRVEDEIVAEINIRRCKEGRDLLPTNEETRLQRQKKKAWKTLPYQVAERLGFTAARVSKESVTNVLVDLGFTVSWDSARQKMYLVYPAEVMGKKRKKPRESTHRWKTIWPQIINTCDDYTRRFKKIRRDLEEKKKKLEEEKAAEKRREDEERNGPER
ncbi:hypothetical protein [Pelagicoccus sp. SDUM812003]|uniref:hypothetical protein n=1 Tax=Pelagicoccus sp. SDUM812003 TaxID=3041267 RepID=UPI00280D8878|nr:hypothetical protein [Pelagicoccus sp. SDUM812003]MDQ8203337.1 hypothetical protein [Pelagicoccus sp. SDUM812003]